MASTQRCSSTGLPADFFDWQAGLGDRGQLPSAADAAPSQAAAPAAGWVPGSLVIVETAKPHLAANRPNTWDRSTRRQPDETLCANGSAAQGARSVPTTGGENRQV